MKLNCLLLVFLFSVSSFSASVIGQRIKDIVSIKGVRDNPLIGYGLVIGLKGTGDGKAEITSTSIKKMFQKLGLNPKQEISSQNIAAVIVTATLPPFGRIGQKIDVTVSSIGDASSLAGGTLIVTPLKGGDGKVYAVAHGATSVGGLSKGAKFATTARVPSGAIIENEIKSSFNRKKSIRLSLKNSDFTTAARIQKIINTNLGGKFAIAKDSTTVDLIIPEHYKTNVVKLLAIVENFRVVTDQKSRVVINERTGTIVAGGEVQLKEIAISHADLLVEISGAKGKPGSIHHIKKKTNLNDLVKALNSMGATPEDLISIFQVLKKNGALSADIEFI
jgi:flagellar P-ring protein precursor FlgI